MTECSVFGAHNAITAFHLETFFAGKADLGPNRDGSICRLL